MGDLEASKIDKANHLLLDQPLLRLPYELLRKNFRAAHFTVEKESTAVKSLLKETAHGSISGRTAPAEVVRSLDTMLARLRGVRRKLVGLADEEARLHGQVDARLSHLAELADMHSLDDVRYEAWSRRRLDRLLVDYMLRHGYTASAAGLARERRVVDLVDIDTFVALGRISDSLRRGSVTEALTWCNENKKELRKMDSKLEFMLRYQQYIELVRGQTDAKLLEAIAHAKRYLTPFKDVYPKEFNQAAGLLAFGGGGGGGIYGFRDGRGPDDELYGQIWSRDRWDMLADLFTETHNQLLSLPSSPLLHMALSSGLSALKTPACHSSAAQEQQQQQQHHQHHQHDGKPEFGLPGMALAGSSVCPICSIELNELARTVPYAHHSKSHVEHDLLLLPNGRVYGKTRLDDYAAKAGLPPASVKDLRTGDVYARDKLKKVFIT